MKIPIGKDISNDEARLYERTGAGAENESADNDDPADNKMGRPSDDETFPWQASWRSWGAPGSIL